MNDAFIVKIMSRQECSKHRADVGTPCWALPSMIKDRVHMAVCNKRARRAGFVGEPTPTSLSRGSVGGRAKRVRV